MYPVLRLAYQLHLAKRAGPIAFDGVQETTHLIWPWDLDVFMELNNGRTLTLFDMGRIPFAHRTGMIDVLNKNNWRLTVAGSTVRYRRRVVLFDRLKMTTRCIGADARFFYIDQTFWKGEEATTSGLFRLVLADENGIVPTAKVMAAMGAPDLEMPLPNWAQAWADADAERPWPPER